MQNWLIFQPIQSYFELHSDNPSIILSWKSKGLSDESIEAPTSPNKTLNPLQNYVGKEKIKRKNFKKKKKLHLIIEK